jgi:hypothetical protein
MNATMTDNMQDAVSVIDGTLARIQTAPIREVLSTLREYAAAVQAASRRWWDTRDALEVEEPFAARQLRDETRFYRGIVGLLGGTDAERQFCERALAAVEALAMRRLSVLRAAGRLGERDRSITPEERVAWSAFEYARSGGSYHAPIERDAWNADAWKLGYEGGSWVAVILDGRA